MVGWWISNRVAAAVKRALGRTNADDQYEYGHQHVNAVRNAGRHQKIVDGA
ncbi:hypothetical protein [Caballeronia sp. M23-90]